MSYVKTCPICVQPFSTSDSRRKTCSKACADVSRSQVQTNPTNTEELTPEAFARVLELVENPPAPTEKLKRLMRDELPDPETLPAAYVKLVHDMWAALTGESDSKTRIA